MAETLFAEVLKSSLDVPSINKYFVADREKTLRVLQVVRPEGRPEGSRFKLAGLKGGVGSSFDFNLENGQWGDWGTGNQNGGYGLIGFLCGTLGCSSAQAVKYLIDKKLLDSKEAKKALNDKDGDPLVLPIPEEHASWEYVLESDPLRRDRGIIKHHWTYRDLDGSLLGYKYRVDERSSAKEVYTMTYRGESGWVKKAWQKGLVPPYGLEDLKDGPSPRILFVEGEKARDRAKELLGHRWKILSFSGVSASDKLWLPDDPLWEDCDIVVWPDNDTAGKEASRRLQLVLEGMTHKPREIRIVRVESIPGLPPKWDIGDWEEGSSVDLGVELERAEVIDSFERVVREYVYVTQTNQFHNLEDRGLIWSTVAFDNRFARYGDKSGTPSKKFLNSLETLKVDDLEFIPGEGQLVRTPAGKVFLNEWYPSPAYSRARQIAMDENITDEMIAHNARHFIQHVERVCADNEVEPEYDPNTEQMVPGTEKRELSDALMTYFSKLISRPMDKLGWVPMLISEHNGTGKTYFVKMTSSILGANRCVTVTVPQYIGQYHDWRDGVLFYELGEAKHDESTDAYEELKKNHNHQPFDFSKIVDRQHGAQKLNIKTRGMKMQRDFLNGYVTSNNLFPLALANSASAEVSDRRLLVIRCEKILSTADADALFGEIATHAEWIGAYLLRYKSRYTWNPGWAPVTGHKRLIMQRDRERAEHRADKWELGKYDEFFYMMQYSKAERVGGFMRKVITGDICREMASLNRVKYPHELARFDRIMEKAGMKAGPRVNIDGQLRRLYAVDESMVGRPDEEWIAEFNKSLKNLKV